MASWQIKQLEKMSETDPDLIDDVLHHLHQSNPVRLEKLVVISIAILTSARQRNFSVSIEKN